METQKTFNLEILYSDSKINQFQYDTKSTLKDLKFFINHEYEIPIEDIKLTYEREPILDDNIILSKILLTSLNKIGGEKIKVRIVPQIHLGNIVKLFKFLPLDSNIDTNENVINLSVDMISSKVIDFKTQVFNLFSKKMEEFNYHLDHSISEFFNSPDEEKLIFPNKNLNENYEINKFFPKIIEDKDNIKFYYIIKNSSVHFYRNNSYKDDTSNLTKEPSIELRKNMSEGQRFYIILQTYNSTIREVAVFPEMTVSELKETIENLFGIKRFYQELLYLVYKLKDDKKTLKDYYVRPQGIIFLRGFYFPLIFIDFYNKNNRSVLGINIAEQICKVKEEIVNRLNLNYDNFSLVCNGRELDEERYLIDYNVIRMQNIYLK